MENKRAIMWSIGAAVLAALMYWASIQKAIDNRIGDLDKKQSIIVAIRDIPPETRIDSTMISRRPFPVAFLPKGFIESEAEVIGQVATSTILQNDPIVKNLLVPFDQSSLDRRIPEGYRAITIGVQDGQEVVGVGGLLRPGHFVDILVTLFLNTEEIERGGGAASQILNSQARNLKAETRTIFQNIQILAVGRDAKIDAADVIRSGPGVAQEPSTRNITVALKPSEVQKLVLAQQIGRIMVSLRRFNDTEVVDLDYLDPFRAFGIKLPVVSGPPPAYREIRGGQVVAAPF